MRDYINVKSTSTEAYQQGCPDDIVAFAIRLMANAYIDQIELPTNYGKVRWNELKEQSNE